MAVIQPPPPSREYNQKRMVDIVRIGHDTLLTEHKKIQDAVLGIYNFQAIPSNRESGKVFQYQLENQSLYHIHEIILQSATATIQPVINAIKGDLFKLENMIQTDFNVDQPDTQLRTQKPELTDEGQKPKTIKERLGFGEKKKRVLTASDPYQHGLPYLTNDLKKLDRLERFSEYQSYGVDLADHTSFVGQMNYLKFHRTRFKFEIASPIIKLHKMYIDMVFRDEKNFASKIAGNLDKEMFKTRNDDKL